jgi:hypothetical protein
MEAVKIKDIADGTYTVLSREAILGKYGRSYILDTTNDAEVKYSIWSNKYLAQYITLENPPKKFIITILEGRVAIPGFKSKITLI